ncbi:hypothetical protein BH24ACT23_BH24ACT23_09620 [soil metagenome]
MAYPEYIREKARQMRSEKRMTLDEIAERLAIGKSTVWYWIRDIQLVPRGRALETPARRRVRELATQSNKERAAAKRQGWYELGLAEFPALTDDPTFRDFVCMYIGEGYRRNRNRVALGNSNPRVIQLAHNWIARYAINKISYAIQYHADQDIDWLRAFWAFKLGIDGELIRLQRKSNSNQLAKRTWRSKYAVMSVGTNDTALRCRIQAWMDCVQDEWRLDSFEFGV